VHRLPPYALGAANWLRALQTLIAEHEIAVIVPCDDRSLLPLYEHRKALPARLVIPNDEAMAVFFDKRATRDLAAASGAPVADAGPVDDETARRLGLPLAVKPRSSMSLAGIGHRKAVQIVREAATLEKALARDAARADYFLEAYFAGDGVGLSVLAQHGEVLCAFQHRRLQEASETGGSSSRISEAVDPALLEPVRAMCLATRLHGVAMFEFRHNPSSGAFVLLEVNARFWGSLPLAIASGIDFPALLLDMLDGVLAKAPRSYFTGIRRSDLTGEYYRILTHSERASGLATRLFMLLSNLPFLLAKTIMAPRLFDSFSPDDPAPWHAERKRIGAIVLQTVGNRVPVVAGRRITRAVKRLRTLLRGKTGPRCVLIVCLGNICRSPFAAARLRQLTSGCNEIISGGTILQEGRPSPDGALLAAPAFGVQLGHHRSQYCAHALLDRADVILVFDDRNVLEIGQLGGDARKMIRLGDFIGQREISDPFGHGPMAFAACYDNIDQAVQVVARELDAEQ
jgi:protein-tyrosine-phosphatase